MLLLQFGVKPLDGKFFRGDNKLKKLKRFLTGCFSALLISVFAATSGYGAEPVFELPGSYAFGPGTKTDGWYVIDGLELSQTSVAFGTVGSNIALDGSSTYFMDAWIIGIGATQTTLAASYHATGTFYRAAAGNVVKIGTGTMGTHETAGAVNLEAYLAENVDGVDVRVVGSAATEIDWAAHVRYMKVTTDGT